MQSPLLKISWRKKNDSKENIVQTNLTGSYNLENILAAVCIGNYFGVEPEKINSAIAEYIPSNNRSQVVKKNSNTIILDCYNANPSSMTAALSNFSGMTAESKIVILGDMFELGADSDAMHSTVIEQLSALAPDKIILIGERFAAAAQKENISCQAFSTTDAARDFFSENKFRNSLILVKGSNAMRLDKLFKVL